jgi:hypothetical protein
MNRPITANLFLVALTASTLLVAAADSAILAVGQSLIIASSGHSSKLAGGVAYNISLNEAKPGFSATHYQTKEQVDGPEFTVAFTEAVQGFRFVTTNPASTVGTVISKGVSISNTTTDTEFDSFNTFPAKIWVSSNPGADLKKPAINPDFTAGIRGISNVTGSINISGLASGTVYFFYGAYRCKPSITACMIDADGPEASILVPDFHNGDFANNGEHYMSSLTFVNDAGYDTIEYDFSAPAGLWVGVVVTGKAKP